MTTAFDVSESGKNKTNTNNNPFNPSSVRGGFTNL